MAYTMLEQRFMESVPNSLRDIAKSLEKLAENAKQTSAPVVAEPKKVWLIQECRYTTEDNNLWMGCNKYTDKDAAMAAFERYKKNAYDECKYGAANDDLDNAEPDELYEYDVYNCNETENHYEVSSDAYDGFSVQINLLEIIL